MTYLGSSSFFHLFIHFTIIYQTSILLQAPCQVLSIGDESGRHGPCLLRAAQPSKQELQGIGGQEADPLTPSVGSGARVLTETCGQAGISHTCMHTYVCACVCMGEWSILGREDGI